MAGHGHFPADTEPLTFFQRHVQKDQSKENPHDCIVPIIKRMIEEGLQDKKKLQNPLFEVNLVELTFWSVDNQKPITAIMKSLGFPDMSFKFMYHGSWRGDPTQHILKFSIFYPPAIPGTYYEEVYTLYKKDDKYAQLKNFIMAEVSGCNDSTLCINLYDYSFGFEEEGKVVAIMDELGFPSRSRYYAIKHFSGCQWEPSTFTLKINMSGKL